MDWRLSNSDSDFDEWRRCAKCRKPIVLSRTLPCLHTVCACCLKMQDSIEFRKFRQQFPDSDVEEYLMPCPLCAFPCYLPNGQNDLQRNNWLLKLIYRERVAWWREFIHYKYRRTTSFLAIQQQVSQIGKKKSKELRKTNACRSSGEKNEEGQAKEHTFPNTTTEVYSESENLQEATENVQCQNAAAKVNRTTTDIQGATGEVQGAFSKEQEAIPKEHETFFNEQGAFPKIQGTLSKEQGAIPKVPRAIANIQVASAEVHESPVIVQGSTAGIQRAIADIQGTPAEKQGAITDIQGAAAKVHLTNRVFEETTEKAEVSSLNVYEEDTFHWSWEDQLQTDIRRIVRKLLLKHWKTLDREFIEPLESDVEVTFPGSGSLRHLFNFELSFGQDTHQCLRANAFSVNSPTGNVMVVGSSLGKGVFFDENGKFITYKLFNQPVIDCSFLPEIKDFFYERFVATGKPRMNKGEIDTSSFDFDGLKNLVSSEIITDTPLLVFTGAVSSDPDIFRVDTRNNYRDITGFHCNKDGTFYVSRGFENKTVKLVDEIGPVPVCTPGKLNYPTHITNGPNDETIISDTGNHRLLIIYAHKKRNRCIGKHGHNDGEFYWPLGVAVDNQGRLFVCDANNFRVQVFNKNYRFESTPIKHTFRMSPSVAQQVKPIDCAIDRHQRVLILFRGRGYCSLQCFQYEHPVWCFYASDEPPPSSLNCCLCCCNRNARDRNDYQRL